MKRKKLYLCGGAAGIVLALFGLFHFTPVFAAPGGFGHGHGGFGPHRIFKVLHRLDLDREQERQIGEIIDKNRPFMRELMFELRDGKIHVWRDYFDMSTFTKAMQ